MEFMVKNEEKYSRKRRHLCKEDGDVQPVRRVKRRRRDPAVVALSCEDNNNQQIQQPQKEADHRTSATTVKRSSKFRGVSRSVRT